MTRISRAPARHLVKGLYETAGAMLIALSITNFAVPAAFPMVGYSGAGVLLNRLFGVPVGLTVLLLNIPTALLCWRLLGREFLLHSLYTIVALSVLTDHVATLLPVYTGERLLAALCAGVLGGAGYALVFLQNASTGGTDFIVMAVRAVRPHLPVGRLSFLCSVAVTAVSECVYPDIDGAIYVLILEFLSAQIVDRVLSGFNAGKVALIVTDHGAEIAAAIDRTIDRGSTILHASGGYRLERRDVVLCACSTRQMPALQAAVRAADPAAFTVVLSSSEVHGAGFHPLVLGRSDRPRRDAP